VAQSNKFYGKNSSSGFQNTVIVQSKKLAPLVKSMLLYRSGRDGENKLKSFTMPQKICKVKKSKCLT